VINSLDASGTLSVTFHVQGFHGSWIVLNLEFALIRSSGPENSWN